MDVAAVVSEFARFGVVLVCFAGNEFPSAAICSVNLHVLCFVVFEWSAFVLSRLSSARSVSPGLNCFCLRG